MPRRIPSVVLPGKDNSGRMINVTVDLDNPYFIIVDVVQLPRKRDYCRIDSVALTKRCLQQLVIICCENGLDGKPCNFSMEP